MLIFFGFKINLVYTIFLFTDVVHHGFTEVFNRFAIGNYRFVNNFCKFQDWDGIIVAKKY